jgi:iron complex transport system ATP-binding protein
MLTARGIELRAGRRTLCRGLDLDVGAGQLWAVLGCNGSGKTTLMHALAGLTAPAAGEICFEGRPLSGHARRALARGVGVLLQREDQEYWGTLTDYVRLGRYPHAGSPFGGVPAGDPAVARAIAECDLAAQALQPYATLSGGERQRARLAQLWAQDTRLLLLDEPLQHLDLRHQQQTLRQIRMAARSGRAVVMVLHDPALAARCDRVLLLYGDGAHAQGSAAEMLEPARLESLFGCRLTVCGSGATAHVMPVI